MRDAPISAELLTWYDEHARALPWRISPAQSKAGVRPDPYAIWMSEVMLQQTTVAAVKSYFTRFMSLWPTVEALANADDATVMGEWAGLGYYARARNLLKCARVVAELGAFPTTRVELEKLPGIGPYTSAAISAIAYDLSEVVVDGNVERVMARLFEITTPLPDAKPELTTLAVKLTPQKRAGDYAQAVMDLGATICTPKSPSCGNCPLNRHCLARKSETQATLPARRPKAAKPIRNGIIYLAYKDEYTWLMERRPDSGLLGGMLGWPGAPWGDVAVEDPPMNANWFDPKLEVRHTFTHFHLRLGLRIAKLPKDYTPVRGEFIKVRPSDLPTVMRKAYDLARGLIHDQDPADLSH